MKTFAMKDSRIARLAWFIKPWLYEPGHGHRGGFPQPVKPDQRLELEHFHHHPRGHGGCCPGHLLHRSERIPEQGAQERKVRSYRIRAGGSGETDGQLAGLVLLTANDYK